MQSTLARTVTLAALLTLALPAGPAAAEDAPGERDVFAAALRASGAIKTPKARAFTLERIALAWARTDFCAEALDALRAGGDAVDAEAALDVALVCAETVADETAGRLLTFARGRVNRAADPIQKALHLAALAGAYAELDQGSDQAAAAARAADALPATCVPLEAVTARAALALRFLDAGMEGWAVHLLSGATRVALAMPGTPRVIDGLWGPDDDPLAALSAVVMDHLRFHEDEAPGFSPPAPLAGCPAAGPPESRAVDPGKPVALAAISAVLRRLGDMEGAALARRLSSTLVWGVRPARNQDEATDGAGSLLAKDAPPEDAIAFLSDVASITPDPARRIFARMVFSGQLKTWGPTQDYLEALMSLSQSPGPPEGNADRFNAAVARAFLDLGDPLRALDVTAKIGGEAARGPILLDLLPALIAVAPERAKELDAGIAEPLISLEGVCEHTAANAAALGDVRRAAIAVEDNNLRNQLLQRLGRYHLRCGDPDRAAGVTRRMSGKRRDRLLWSVAMQRLDAGDAVAALETIKDIRSQGHRARAIAEVALRLGKSGGTLDAAGADLLRSMTP